MLDDLTERIFAVMLRPFEATGILLPEQIPDYIIRLEKVIKLERLADTKKSNASDQTNSLRKDPLERRAFPFLELLKQAQKNNEGVVWGLT